MTMTVKCSYGRGVRENNQRELIGACKETATHACTSISTGEVVFHVCDEHVGWLESELF